MPTRPSARAERIGWARLNAGGLVGAPGATAMGRLAKSSDLRIFPHQFESHPPGLIYLHGRALSGIKAHFIFYPAGEM